jgi:hypothetical protein
MPPGPRSYTALPRRPSNGVAIAGFVVSLVGALLALVPFIGVFAWLLCSVGLGLSIAGLVRGVRRRAGRTFAVAGVVLGLVGLGICTFQASVWISAFQHAPAPPPPPPPAALDRGAGPLTLEVTGADAYAWVRYTTSSGATAEVDTALPFRTTIAVPPTGPVALSATASPDEDQPPGPVNCTITQAGHLVVSHELEGRVSCSAQ